MSEIPAGLEPYVDEDGDQVWLDADGERSYVGPGGATKPKPGWRPLYVGPPAPKPRTLEDKVCDLAALFDKLAADEDVDDDTAAEVWRCAASDLRGLLRADDQ